MATWMATRANLHEPVQNALAAAGHSLEARLGESLFVKNNSLALASFSSLQASEQQASCRGASGR